MELSIILLEQSSVDSTNRCCRQLDEQHCLLTCRDGKKQQVFGGDQRVSKIILPELAFPATLHFVNYDELLICMQKDDKC
jgi:hypothetical protein